MVLGLGIKPAVDFDNYYIGALDMGEQLTGRSEPMNIAQRIKKLLMFNKTLKEFPNAELITEPYEDNTPEREIVHTLGSVEEFRVKRRFVFDEAYCQTISQELLVTMQERAKEEALRDFFNEIKPYIECEEGEDGVSKFFEAKVYIGIKPCNIEGVIKLMEHKKWTREEVKSLLRFAHNINLDELKG